MTSPVHNTKWVLEFINIYRHHECTWNTKHPDYTNRRVRERAYDALAEKMDEVMHGATRHDVTKRINNMRTCFRKEYKKVTKALREGLSYTPRLWYYDKMLFLTDSEAQINQDSDTEGNLDENSCAGMKFEENNESKTEEQKSARRSAFRDSVWLSEFIEVYRENEPIWNTKNPDYRNRRLKDHCYSVLVDKLKEVEPDADRAAVTRKINNIRSCFMKEYRKAKRLLKSGLDYTPKLWYYNQMLFLKESDNGLDDEDASCDDNDYSNTEDYEIEPLDSDDPLIEAQSDEGAEGEYDVPIENNKRKRRKTSKNLWDNPIQFTLPEQPKETAADIFGKHVAAKLTSVSQNQRIFLEKLINDAIFEAELENLSRSSRIEVGVSADSGNELIEDPVC